MTLLQEIKSALDTIKKTLIAFQGDISNAKGPTLLNELLVELNREIESFNQHCRILWLLHGAKGEPLKINTIAPTSWLRRRGLEDVKNDTKTLPVEVVPGDAIAQISRPDTTITTKQLLDAFTDLINPFLTAHSGFKTLRNSKELNALFINLNAAAKQKTFNRDFFNLATQTLFNILSQEKLSNEEFETYIKSQINALDASDDLHSIISADLKELGSTIMNPSSDTDAYERLNGKFESLNSLQEKISETQSKIQPAETKLAALENKEESLTTSANKAEADLKKAQADASEANKKLGTATKENTQAEATLGKAQVDASEAERKLDTATKENIQAQANPGKAQAKHDDALEALKKAHTDVNKANELLEKAKRPAGKANEPIKTAQTTVGKANAALVTAKTNYEAAKAALNAPKENTDNKSLDAMTEASNALTQAEPHVAAHLLYYETRPEDSPDPIPKDETALIKAVKITKGILTSYGDYINPIAGSKPTPDSINYNKEFTAKKDFFLAHQKKINSRERSEKDAYQQSTKRSLGIEWLQKQKWYVAIPTALFIGIPLAATVIIPAIVLIHGKYSAWKKYKNTADLKKGTGNLIENNISALNKLLEKNTALETAQANAGEAEAALKRAQTATDKANTALETAQTAAGEAEAALETAQTAAGKANTALETAQTAAGEAEAALETAQANAGEAEAALGRAKTAAGKANTALETAQTAAGKAKAALETAKTPAGEANTALKKAQTAAGEANAALKITTKEVNDTRAEIETLRTRKIGLEQEHKTAQQDAMTPVKLTEANEIQKHVSQQIDQLTSAIADYSLAGEKTMQRATARLGELQAQQASLRKIITTLETDLPAKAARIAVANGLDPAQSQLRAEAEAAAARGVTANQRADAKTPTDDGNSSGYGSDEDNGRLSPNTPTRLFVGLKSGKGPIPTKSASLTPT